MSLEEAAEEEEIHEVSPRVEAEEGRRPRMLASPMQVSKRERDEHELTHLPFRAWCPHCVRGRGSEDRHMKYMPK